MEDNLDMRLKNNFYIDRESRTFSHVQTDPHYHSYYELFFVSQGSCRFLIYDKAYHLRAGDILVIAPPEHHLSIYDRAQISKRYVIYFNPEAIDARILKELPFASDFLKETRKLLMNNTVFDTLVKTADRMVDAFNRQDEVSKLLPHVLFQEFLLHISKNCTIGTADKKEFTIENDLERAARYVARNYSNDIRLSDAAAAAGLTPTYFSKKFKAIIGVGFSDYLTQIRLTKAASLLKDSDMSITAISEACGFSNSNYFGDVFRDAFSLSPRAYRNSFCASLKN